jgi:pyridoxine kinase
MLTGYIGSAQFLDSISKVIERVKAVNPDLKYFCDPVLGDNGKFYVA